MDPADEGHPGTTRATTEAVCRVPLDVCGLPARGGRGRRLDDVGRAELQLEGSDRLAGTIANYTHNMQGQLTLTRQ
jgi:hypothetical protein